MAPSASGSAGASSAIALAVANAVAIAVVITATKLGDSVMATATVKTTVIFQIVQPTTTANLESESESH